MSEQDIIARLDLEGPDYAGDVFTPEAIRGMLRDLDAAPELPLWRNFGTDLTRDYLGRARHVGNGEFAVEFEQGVPAGLDMWNRVKRRPMGFGMGYTIEQMHRPADWRWWVPRLWARVRGRRDPRPMVVDRARVRQVSAVNPGTGYLGLRDPDDPGPFHTEPGE